MLISPTEPHEFRKLGTVSSVPEKYGADFIIPSPVFGRVGVQRKEVKDLVASLADGRVEREVWQQKALSQAVWLIEGRLEWTSDGSLLSAMRSRYTKASHLGVILSLQSNGYWVLNSTSLTDSIELLSSLSRWLMKARHGSLLRRPSMSRQAGGDLTDRQIHVMQGFDGVGYEKAKAIVEALGGLPFSMGEEEYVALLHVKGVGKGLAERVRRTIGREGDIADGDRK